MKLLGSGAEANRQGAQAGGGGRAHAAALAPLGLSHGARHLSGQFAGELRRSGSF